MAQSNPESQLFFPPDWHLVDVLWDDRFGTGYSFRAPGALIVTLAGQCGYNRLVEICYYTGRNWKPAVETLVIDFGDLKSVDKDGIRFLISQLRVVVDRTGGRVHIVHAPPEAKRLLFRQAADSPIRLASSVTAVLEKVARQMEEPKVDLYRHGPPDPDNAGETITPEGPDDFCPTRRIQLREIHRHSDGDVTPGGGLNLLDVLP